MAFRVPGEFSDVFVGSVHSMSCVLGCQRELVGADLVLAATRLAFGQTHWLGLDLPGAAFALVGGDLAGGAAGICRTRLGGVLC